MSHAGPLEAVFFAALEKGSPEERAAFLDEACGGDADLRHRVEKMLSAHAGAGSFLEAPAAHVAPTIDMPGEIAEGPGTVIGPYKLLEQIGEGGFGVVFLAEQQHPVRRRVALKIIKPGMDTWEVIARFEAERQALALMDHPGIAHVFDAGSTGSGRPYFVMELVRGVPITEYCDRHNLTPRERLELFATVCQAVQHAHQKGVIHRDIKPSNVLVALHDGRPVPKVIDFGLAKAMNQQLTERTLFTQQAQMLGTPLYMSPEQAEHTSLDIDTRSDIYSLGVLLYELLTGTTPLPKQRLREAAFDEVVRIIREEEPPRPSLRLSSLGDKLPGIAAHRHTEPKKLGALLRGELDWIVMKALEKDRTRRYETANGFAADILRYLADEPVSACPPSAAYRFKKFARRNKAALATGAVVASALVAAVVILGVSNAVVRAERNAKDEALGEKVKALGEKQTALGEREAALKEAKANYAEAKRQEGLAKTSAADAHEQRRIAQEQEGLARRRFYAAQMNLAMQAWERGDLARVLDLLESQRPEPGKEDLRAFEWYYLWRLCHSGRRLVLHGHSGYVHSVAFSPDGHTLASGGGDGTVKLWDLATGQAQRTLQAVAGVNAVAFSPDGQAVVAGCSDGLIRLWDLGTGELRTTFRGHQDIVWTVTFGADGKTLVSGSQDRTVVLWDVATGTRQATLEGHGFPVLHAAISPDGKTVASATWPQLPAKVWDVATRRERFELPGRTVTFSADGTLATSGWFGVKLWDVATGKELGRSPASDEMGEVGVSAFSPAGQTLVFASFTRTVWLWDIPRGELRARLGRQGPIQAIALSPDGGALAVAANDGPIEVWDRSLAEETMPLVHGTGPVTFAFSPDQKTLASGGTSGAKFWDLTTGRVVADVASSPAMHDPTKPYSSKHVWTALAGALAFSPDGGLLAIPDEKAVKLIDAATHQKVGTLIGHDQPVYLVAFSGDGRFLATLAADGAKRWDLATRQVTTVIPQCQSFSLALSPDGQTLVTGGQGRLVELWDALTGQRKAALLPPGEHYEWTRAVTFSPDGKTLAVGGTHGHISLWDVESGRLRTALRGETQIVATLAFSPDGKTLASGTDRTIKLWEVATGQERITLKRGARLLAFSPDGNTLGVGVRGQVLLLTVLSNPPAARVARQQEKFATAEAALRAAHLRAPTPAEPPEARGWTLLNEQKFAEAEAAFRAAIRVQPTLASAHHGLGRSFREQNKVADSLVPLREAVRLDRDNHRAHEALGWTLIELKQFAEAEVEFREVIRLRPDLPGGHFGLGKALQEQNKPLEAIASFREAIRLNPDHAAAHDAIGWQSIRQQQPAEAEAAFRECVRLEPERAGRHFGLGRALFDQQKFAEAETALREVLRREPAHPFAPQLLGRALIRQGRRSEAEELLKQKPAHKPQDTEKSDKPAEPVEAPRPGPEH